MKALPILDSHLHLWGPVRLRYKWLDGLPALNRAFLPVDFSAASVRAKVEKMIFVECGCELAQSLAEVDWVCELAKREPRLKGIVAQAPLEKGIKVRGELAALASRLLVKGVRRLLQDEADADFFTRIDFVTGVKLLAEFGFTFDVCIRQDQLRGIIKLVRDIPQVTFVLNHLGKPEVRNGQFAPWAKELKVLAALPNVVCKISGLATQVDCEKWQASELKPYFDQAAESFGFDRLLFGGDWPVATLATDYQRWIETVQAAFSSAQEGDLIKLFKTNAERVYRV